LLCSLDPILSVTQKAKVLFRGARSRSFHIRCGVPQGSVLGLALFILYLFHPIRMSTTSLKPSLRRPNTRSMLMISIWSSSPDPLKAAHSVQKALDHLKECFLKWRLPVNPAKRECCFFSTDPIKHCINPNSL